MHQLFSSCIQVTLALTTTSSVFANLTLQFAPIVRASWSRHFLLDCPFYQHEQHELQMKLRCNMDLLSFLLSSPVATKPLLKFVHATGHFKTHFGKDAEDKILIRALHNAELYRAYKALDKSISDVAAHRRQHYAFHSMFQSFHLTYHCCCPLSPGLSPILTAVPIQSEIFLLLFLFCFHCYMCSLFAHLRTSLHT